MTFTPGQSTEYPEPPQISMLSRAFRRVGKPVVLVPLGAGLHAGHIAAVRAAKRIPTAIVVVAVHPGVDIAPLRAEQVDAVFRYTTDSLWPKGPRTLLTPQDHGLEPVAELAQQLSLTWTLLNLVQPSDIVLGEKDFELLLAIQHAVTDLHQNVKIHGVPTVRNPDGLAMSLRNPQVSPEHREQAMVLSAALTAGAHAAEGGATAVLETAAVVLDAAGITPEYLELRGLDLGEAPVEGDARLLVAATIGGVRLTDNVGVPVGIGFRNLADQEQ